MKALTVYLKQILIAMEIDLNAIIQDETLSAHYALYKMAMFH